MTDASATSEPDLLPDEAASPASSERGPEAVKRKLVDAAKVLMTMRSPRQISGRELARQAGVNYGLIHHYFGSKDNVFAQAVAEATEAMAQRWDSRAMVPTNTTDDARTYRTFAKLEIEQSQSPIADLLKRIVSSQTTARGCDPSDADMLGDIAVAAALQFGWGAFEDEIVDALSEYGTDREGLRALVAQRSLRLIEPNPSDG